jgi:hypothetical protein
MRTLQTLAAALALASAPLAPARAAILATAPAQAGASPQRMWCSIVNLNPAPHAVTVELMDYAGDVVNHAGMLLLPNEGQSIGDASGNAAWCRFTVDTSPRKFRAAAIYDSGTAYTVSIPAE